MVIPIIIAGFGNWLVHTRTTGRNKICRHSTDNISNDTHIGTRHVILAKHWLWLPVDGFVWTETCWSSFYNSNCLNNLL
jgi:hypothetical protein